MRSLTLFLYLWFIGCSLISSFRRLILKNPTLLLTSQYRFLARNEISSHVAFSSLKIGAFGDKDTVGKVFLVGAGPGDPELLTLAALKRIQSAKLVVADRLISKEILALATCEVRIANKRPGCAEMAQEELNGWVIEAALAGKDVVRLKIGDPFLFGRGFEEIIEYKKHGIHAEVLPGLSSSYAAPLVANIPLTHRGVANKVHISTGYGQNSSYVDLPMYDSDCTVVLLMAVGRIAEISDTLITLKRYPPSLPISIIESATTKHERVLKGQLSNIGQIAVEQEAKAPAVIVIGHVVNVL